MSVSINGAGSISGIDQGLNVTGVGTFQTLNVTGVLTYDDVTNIDSIGIVTARTGLTVTSGLTDLNGDLDVAGVSTFRDDVKINYGSGIGLSITNGGDFSTADIVLNGHRNLTNSAVGEIKVLNRKNNEYNDIRVLGNGDFQFRHNGVDLVRISDIGSVGIGTAVPDSVLTVAGDSATARLELKRTNQAGGGSYGAINFTALDGHSVASIHAKGDGDGDDNGADIVFRTTSAATSNDPYTITERLRIASDGRIGLSGENYGTNNQVLTSQGTGVPEWRGVNAAFYGRQDAAHNITHATWTTVKNFASDVVNSITGWSESTGIFTANADTAGTYYVFGSCGIDDVQSTDVMRVGICKNNESPGAFTEYRMFSGATNTITGGTMVGRIVTLADGDNVRMKVYHNEGTTEPTEPNRTFFGGFRLSV